MPTFRIGFACLLFASATSAQDYRVTAEKGAAWGCLQKSYAVEMSDLLSKAEANPDFITRYNATMQLLEILDGQVQKKMCAVYQSDDVLTIVAEDEEDPEWIQVKPRNWLFSTREMWSRREWFEPVP